MGGNPRDHVKDKGFWDGGSSGSASNKDSAGRASGFPGQRKPKTAGVRSDLEYPEERDSDSIQRIR